MVTPRDANASLKLCLLFEKLLAILFSFTQKGFHYIRPWTGMEARKTCHFIAAKIYVNRINNNFFLFRYESCLWTQARKFAYVKNWIMEKNLLTAQHKALTLEQIFPKLTHQSDVNRRHWHRFGIFIVKGAVIGIRNFGSQFPHIPI